MTKMQRHLQNTMNVIAVCSKECSCTEMGGKINMGNTWPVSPHGKTATWSYYKKINFHLLYATVQGRRLLYYPGGQTQPGMHGVLGGQVRFSIRLWQVGTQVSPPLCSVQLWYTFPSGHSPTSTLSGSTIISHTQTHTQENQCNQSL